MGWLHPALLGRKRGFGDPRDPPGHGSLVDLLLSPQGTRIWWSHCDLQLVCGFGVVAWGDSGSPELRDTCGVMKSREFPSSP